MKNSIYSKLLIILIFIHFISVIGKRIKNKIPVVRFLTSIFLFVALSCSENTFIPKSFWGELCEGGNGTISASGRWQEFNTSNSCLPSNTIRCLEVDHNNNLWIGTDNGLVFYDGSKWIIYNTSNSLIPFNVILSIACEGDTVWVGGADALAKFDNLNWTIYNSTNSPLGNSPGIIGITILTLKVDSKHNIWAGTNYYGLYKFDKTNWTSFAPTFECPISSASIASIDIDALDVVWLGHFEQGGVDRFDGSNWTNYTPENSPLPYWDISDVHVDKMNVKWFATPFGLAGFDDVNWTVYDSTNSIFQWGVTIGCITTDSKNSLWAGTGIGLINKNDNNWIVYDFNEIPNLYNAIFYVLTDQYDNKWLGTFNGLYKFNENGIKNYTHKNKGEPQ